MRIIALEKEILFNEAEERLQRQARRVVYTMAAVFAALLAANNVVFWIIWELRTS